MTSDGIFLQPSWGSSLVNHCEFSVAFSAIYLGDQFNRALS